MTQAAAPEQRARVEEFQRRHRTGLVTLLFTDIVGSTRLKQQHGDTAGFALILRHHSIVRELLSCFDRAEEISTAGDSFFLVFAKPSDAVKFALLLQARLRALAKKTGQPVLDRIGIHVGEVVIEEQAAPGKPRDFYGIQVDTCARVMSLGKGGQTLLTRFAFDNARQVLKGQDLEGLSNLSWVNHGFYLLAGVEEPTEICEVGEALAGPLAPPTTTEKGQRLSTPDQEPVLGWRPALEQKVPGTPWTLEEKLGEGGFGEVWLGRHETFKRKRVFKFCFRADRVRSLKREVTLFKLLHDRVGEHPNIVTVHDVFFGEPPYYITMDFVEGRDLVTWAREQGGVEKLPLETRLEIGAQVADALQAAHDAGVIHRDVKPSNILISSVAANWRSPPPPSPGRAPPGSSEAAPATENVAANASSPLRAEAKLTDFGIGQVVSEEFLAGHTRAGFTQTMLSSTSSHTGTQMYMAPELLAGKPASTRSDIYSLGVVLYQLLVGDFTRPLTTDWADHLGDPLLRDDLKHCFAGNPQDRFAGAGQLAKQLRQLPERRAALEQQQAELAARERAAYRRGVIRATALATAVVALMAALACYALIQGRRARQENFQARRHLYIAHMNLAGRDWEMGNLGRLRQLLEETRASPDRGFEWFYWQRLCHLELLNLSGHTGSVFDVAFSPDDQRLATKSPDGTVKIWDQVTGKELLTFQQPWPPGAKYHSLAFSPDGQRVVSGTEGGTAVIWEATTGRPLTVLQRPGKHVAAVAFSPDGLHVVSGGDGGAVVLWEATSGRELRSFEGLRGSVRAVEFSADGRRVGAAADPEAVQLWETHTGRNLERVEIGVRIDSFALSPDGSRVAVATHDPTPTVWDAATGRRILELKGHTTRVRSVAYSRDGSRIVTSGEDHTARIWDAGSGGAIRILRGHSATVWRAVFSPQGDRVLTASTGPDGTAKLWDALSDQEAVTVRPHADSAFSVAFSPDSRWLLTGGASGADGVAKILDAATGSEIRTLTGHTQAVRCAIFSSDGRFVITATDDAIAKLWDASTGAEIRPFKGHAQALRALAISPDGTRIATSSMDGTVRVWDAASGASRFTLAGPQGDSLGVIGTLSFSPDGSRLLTASWSGTARVWDAETGAELLMLNHRGWVPSAAFSPDGDLIVTAGGTDTLARLWDARTGRELRQLVGHNLGVLTLAFSPDGKRIVTSGWDATVKVWHAETGRETLSLQGPSETVSSVAFSPDGMRIAAAGNDGFVRIWQAAESGRLGR
jgi:WD40 repeat protein/serine/threonine protein kinase/class 3 adenylate cyclase